MSERGFGDAAEDPFQELDLAGALPEEVGAGGDLEGGLVQGAAGLGLQRRSAGAPQVALAEDGAFSPPR